MVFMVLHCVCGQKFIFNTGPQVMAQRKVINLPIVALCQ